MIVTYLSGYETLIGLTHVCTHWRRVITTCPTFWTDIRFGGKDMIDSLANLFFERANGCPLDVYISPPPYRRRILAPRHHTIPTLSPGKRIKTLRMNSGWVEILEVLGRWADALSPLQSLDLSVMEASSFPSRPTIFLGDALTDLKLSGVAVPGLGYIRAPNLTTFGLWDNSQTSCSVTTLLDFLEATPALEEVSIEGSSLTTHDFPPPNKTITLPHVRLILLGLRRACQLASHLVCPSLMDTRLVDAFPVDPAVGIFTPPFHQLLGQYSVEMINRVAMTISDQEALKECFLQLGTPSDTRFLIGYETQESFDSDEDPDPSWTFSVLFNQALSALLSLPLHNVVTFTIDVAPSPYDDTIDPTDIVTRFAAVFKQCPKLHEVVLDRYPPRCLSIFSRDITPPVQVLIIKHHEDVSWEELAERITEVARVRHSKGAPLKRIEIITATENNPRIERLESWVQEVRYQVEPPQKKRPTSWA